MMHKYFLLFFALFLVVGCATPNPPLFLMYPDGVIKDQSKIATIIARYDAIIDGEEPKRVFKASGSTDELLWAYDILPGKHVLVLSYTPTSTSSNTVGSTVHTTKYTYMRDMVEIEYDFEAGRIYWATVKGWGDTATLLLEKDTPADKKGYLDRNFNPAKVIENINKSRMLP